MKLEFIKDKYHYFGENYEFLLSDEKYHKHATTIIKPKHIKIRKNQTELTTRELKEKIIEEWFKQENEQTRTTNNEKRRKK